VQPLGAMLARGKKLLEGGRARETGRWARARVRGGVGPRAVTAQLGGTEGAGARKKKERREEAPTDGPGLSARGTRAAGLGQGKRPAQEGGKEGKRASACGPWAREEGGGQATHGGDWAAGKETSPRGKRGAGRAGLGARVAFLFPSLFLFKQTQIYLNSNQFWIQTPMHSLK
jgi:hypothetical protein